MVTQPQVSISSTFYARIFRTNVFFWSEGMEKREIEKIDGIC